jgi:hypothetical protein
LEGYIRGQWRGADALEVLFGLGIGLGSNGLPKASDERTITDQQASRSSARAAGGTHSGEEDDDDDASYDDDPLYPSSTVDGAEFEPDGMPALYEAAEILFGRDRPPYSMPDSSSDGHSSHLPPAAQVNIDDFGYHPCYHGESGPSSKKPSAMWLSRPGVGSGDLDWESETSERLSEVGRPPCRSPNLLILTSKIQSVRHDLSQLS